MKTSLAPSLTTSSRALLMPCLALAFSLDTASAQQTANYAPPAGYRQQPGYGSYQPQRPGVGERVGGFVKRLFYGESQSSYAQPQQYNRAYQSGRSLDAPPSVSRRLEPTSQSRSSSMPPTAAQNRSAPTSKPDAVKKPETAPAKPSSSSKYTPPRIKPESSAPKSQPKPAPQKVEEQPPAPAPTEPAPYTPPAPRDTPPVIDNKPSEAPTTLAGLSSSQPNAGTASTTPPPPSVEEPKSTPKETPASNSTSGQFLIGKKTATPGRVISPYPPYQELDVSGLSSGSLALDPTTDKVFQIP